MTTRTYINPKIFKVKNSNLYGFRILEINDEAGIGNKAQYFTSKEDAVDGLLNYVKDLVDSTEVEEVAL